MGAVMPGDRRREPKVETLSIRLTSTERKTLERRAAEERRSLSAHVGWLVTQDGKKHPNDKAK
jgi:hypothetical protein